MLPREWSYKSRGSPELQNRPRKQLGKRSSLIYQAIKTEGERFVLSDLQQSLAIE